MIKVLLIVIATILGYFLISFLLKILNLKKNIVHSSVNINMCLKKKENTIRKILTQINKNNEYVPLQEFQEFVDEFDLILKIDAGQNLSKKIIKAIQKEYRLQMDGEVGLMIDSLRALDIKIEEYKQKYIESCTEYDLKKEKFPMKFIIEQRDKFKKRNEIKNDKINF